MSLRLLRECVRAILEDVAGPRVQPVTADDFEDVFVDFNDFTKRNGVKVYAALKMLDGFKPHSELARLGQAYQFGPQDVAHLLKKGDNSILRPEYRDKDTKQFDLGDITSIKLVLQKPEIRERILQQMTASIVRQFRGAKIDEVLAVDSSYAMSKDLAEKVAAGLGVPLGSVLEKESDPKRVDWDMKEFEHWVRNVAPESAKAAGKPLEDYVLGMLRDLDKTDHRQVKGAIEKGRKPSIARDIPQRRRRFWNFFKKLQASDTPKRVLVVDDNVASGWTSLHAAKRLQDAGLEPFFAVGYVW